MLTVSHPSPLTSWYKFYCLVSRDTKVLVACPRAISQKVGGVGYQTLTIQPIARPPHNQLPALCVCISVSVEINVTEKI